MDLGGIAKGYALDRGAEILRREGIKEALLNAGGDILALRGKGKSPWSIGIRHPRDSKGILATLELLDYAPTLVAAASSYDSSLPAALGGDGGETAGLEMLGNLYLVGTWPPFESDAPGMKLLRDNLDRYGPADLGVDPFFFIGYTQAATFHLILEEALESGDLTRAGVWEARNRIGDVDFGFGAGPASYDGDRVPIVADVLAVPAPAGDAQFGMMPVGSYYPTR